MSRRGGGREGIAGHSGSKGRAWKPLALRLTEVTEDDLYLEGAELLAAFDVLGVEEVGHEVWVGVDFASEEAPGDLFVIAREIASGQVLFECVT